MKTSDLLFYIGKRVSISTMKLTVYAKVLDGRTSFGRKELLLTPEAGSGSQWFVLDNIKLEGKYDGQ